MSGGYFAIGVWHFAPVRRLGSSPPPHFTIDAFPPGLWGYQSVSFLVLATFAFGLFCLSPYDSSWRSKAALLPSEVLNVQESMSAGERKLVVVLPVNEPSNDLCRLVASAVALGYPAPVIVNWNEQYQNDENGLGPSHLSKVTGVHDFLSWATGDDVSDGERLAEDDLVLVMDAQDIWMQLGPDVLLQRYYSVNARANQRLADKYGSASAALMKQTTIVSAQKGCVAPRNRISNLNCDAVPQSPLPADVYGLFTDTAFMHGKYLRPRYVNSGGFMGPAGDMRRYFQRVRERMDEHILDIRSWEDLGGDQGIFAEIYGEQEVWRQKADYEGLLCTDDGGNVAEAGMEAYEYHIGLDYEQEMFYPTCNSEVDGTWVHVHDAEHLAEQSSEAGVRPPRIRGLPEDIAQAVGPLAKLDDDELSGRTWGDVALYADFWTTSIPVAIHHNAYRKGIKSRRKTWWDRTWYFPHLRNLLEAQVASKSTEPLFRTEAADGILVVRPYGPLAAPEPLLFETDKQSGLSGLRATSWNSVCRSKDDNVEAQSPWYDEVFRDGRGTFRADFG
ncbi:hypothetical protein B0A50_04677 [Salinomyces thailandicus]|uniref:Uncharacterized protein n=1 Tax=Salinomyces thailandicus TaxID=706561 RepID=A0A4U0TV35_9PEZI|nr:hypothetical protein B0A50_04677 [Salinomyces thailandica]